MKKTGGCACGAIRFEVTKPFIALGSCHCTDCQKASGGGANYVALTPRDGLKVTAGNPKLFAKQGDSGATVHRAFCPECGTPLWSQPKHEPFLPIKVGAFDEIIEEGPAMQIYVRSAPSWHARHEDCQQFETMPTF